MGPVVIGRSVPILGVSPGLDGLDKGEGGIDGGRLRVFGMVLLGRGDAVC